MPVNNDYKNTRLLELGGSDYEIADGQPDIKGWDVKDQNGKRIGEVDELLFDPQTQRVYYMVVDLEDNVLDLEPRDVLIPIGIASLHEKDDDVVLPNVSVDTLRALPVYEKHNLTWDVENRTRHAFSGTLSSAQDSIIPESEFYKHDYYDDRNLYKNRSSGISPATGNTGAAPSSNQAEQGHRIETDAWGIRLRSRNTDGRGTGNTNDSSQGSL